nr:HD domain-containing protein [uncultured Flavobacterium sp.]
MNRSFLQKARDFAINSHGDQKYGDYPYEIHLGHVVNVLLRFGVMPDTECQINLMAAAWLHDVLEDTPVTYEQIEAAFNPEIARIVHSVTDEPGNTRRERKEKTYVKLAQNPDGVIVKLADRIANVEFSLVHGNIDLLDMYQKEQPGFEAAIKAALNTPLYNALLDHLKRCYTSYMQ